MDEKVRKILARPFAVDAVKTRVGPGGVTLSYVELQNYVDRLNEAFDGTWSFENIRHDIVEDQIVVEIRLTAGDIVKTGVGGAQVTRRRDNGKALCIADDIKKAEADGLKRAARLLGVGAALYGGEVAEGGDEEPAREQEHDLAADGGDGRVTASQLGKMRELVHELGGDWPAFRAHVRAAHGVNVEYASRRLGSTLIEDLLGRVRQRKPNGAHRTERRPA
jgi:hypothetical protein